MSESAEDFLANILVAYIGYPDSLGRHVKNELARMGHQVTHIGPYSGGVIPWEPGKTFMEFSDKPDVCLEYPGPQEIELNPGVADRFDLILELDSAFFLRGARKAPKALWAIDNHVRDYALSDADYFFGGHSWGYGSDRKNFHWLPSCYDPYEHHEIPILKKIYHLGFFGVLYQHRQELIRRLGEHGYIYTGQGVFRAEYNVAYGQCFMGLGLSARGDVPHRVFENAAQGLLIFADAQHDMPKLGLVDGENCIVFKDLLQDPIDRFNDIKDNLDRITKIAKAGQLLLAPHTYQARIREILKVVGLDQ